MIIISILKRIIYNLGLYHRKYESDIIEIACFDWSSQMHGCHWLHLKCLGKEIVDQDTIRILLHLLDPERHSVQNEKNEKACLLCSRSKCCLACREIRQSDCSSHQCAYAFE